MPCRSVWSPCVLYLLSAGGSFRSARCLGTASWDIAGELSRRLGQLRERPDIEIPDGMTIGYPSNSALGKPEAGMAEEGRCDGHRIVETPAAGSRPNRTIRRWHRPLNLPTPRQRISGRGTTEVAKRRSSSASISQCSVIRRGLDHRDAHGETVVSHIARDSSASPARRCRWASSACRRQGISSLRLRAGRRSKADEVESASASSAGRISSSTPIRSSSENRPARSCR